METTTATTATADKPLLQGQDWAGAMGEKWHRYHANFENMIAPIGHATLALAAVKPGERVVDIGCGTGPTTLALARQVGTAGAVAGLDISSVLLDSASARAQRAGIANISWHCGDAATLTLEQADFDCVFSRFGVMFFADPDAAFKNLGAMLKPGGRLVFCCWGPPGDNPWVGSLSALVNRHIALPPPNPVAPGPFAFADQARTRGILEQAGFADVTFSAWRDQQLLGGPGLSLDDIVTFTEKAFFIGEVLEGQSDDLRAAVLADVRRFLADRMTTAGVALEAMAWLVTARKADAGAQAY